MCQVPIKTFHDIPWAHFLELQFECLWMKASGKATCYLVLATVYFYLFYSSALLLLIIGVYFSKWELLSGDISFVRASKLVRGKTRCRVWLTLSLNKRSLVAAKKTKLPYMVRRPSLNCSILFFGDVWKRLKGPCPKLNKMSAFLVWSSHFEAIPRPQKTMSPIVRKSSRKWTGMSPFHFWALFSDSD